MEEICEIDKMALADCLRNISKKKKNAKIPRVYTEEQIETIIGKIHDSNDLKAAIANPSSFLECDRSSNIPKGENNYEKLLKEVSEGQKLR